MNTATFEVDGMVIRGGFLWLGWPNDIGKTLDELKGVSLHKFDNQTWIFTVIFNPKEVKKGVPKNDAEEAKKKLEAAGAKVELK